jgi:hypothetical protein
MSNYGKGIGKGILKVGLMKIFWSEIEEVTKGLRKFS